MTKNAAFYQGKCFRRPLVKDFILNHHPPSDHYPRALKCEACNWVNSKTRYLQAQPATRGIPVQVLETSSAKRLLVRGEVDRFCHWHRRRRETADYRLARTNRPKKMKKTDMSVSKLKQQASRKKRKWCTMRCNRQKSRSVDRVASHISTRAWIAAQKPESTV